VVEQYLVMKGVVALCLTRWCRSFAMTRRVVCSGGLLLTTERWPRQVVSSVGRAAAESQSRAEDGWGCLGMSRRLKPQPQSGSRSHRAQEWLQRLMWAYEGVSASSRHMLLEPKTVGRDGSARECSQADGAAASAVSGLQGAVLLPDEEL
jgi:hypothetical protein